MGLGWLNPHDDGLATGVRPAHEPTGAGADRWFADALNTKIHAQDLNALMAALRSTVSFFGLTPAEGDDDGLKNALLAALAMHPRRNLLANPSFRNWPNGTGPLAETGLGPANWVMNNIGTSVASVERKPGMLNGRYCVEWNFTTVGGPADVVNIALFPGILGVVRLGGRRLTLTGTIKGEAGIDSLTARLIQFFGTGGSPFIEVVFPTIPVTTAPTRFEVAVDMPSVAGKTIASGDATLFRFERAPTSPLGKIWLEDLKLEPGGWATGFQPPAPDDEAAAIGFPTAKNLAHNPSFVLWQDGATSVAASAAIPHVSDRWRCYRAVAGATVSRQTGFAGAFDCVRVQRNAGNIATEMIGVGQQVERHVARQLGGKWVILSFDLRGGADFSALQRRISVGFATGTGEEEAFTPAGANCSFPTGNTTFNAFQAVGAQYNAVPQSGYRRHVSSAFQVPAGISEFGFSIGFVPTGTAGANDWFEATNVKLELCGPAGWATAFEPQSYEETLQACRRFYCKSFAPWSPPIQNAGAGTGEWRFPATRAAAAQNRLGSVRFGTTMRLTPTITFFNPAAANAQARNLTGGADCSATAAQNISPDGFEIVATGDGAAAIGDDLGVHWTADARL